MQEQINFESSHENANQDKDHGTSSSQGIEWAKRQPGVRVEMMGGHVVRPTHTQTKHKEWDFKHANLQFTFHALDGMVDQVERAQEETLDLFGSNYGWDCKAIICTMETCANNLQCLRFAARATRHRRKIRLDSFLLLP